MDRKNLITMLANTTNTTFSVNEDIVTIHCSYAEKDIEFHFNDEGELTHVFCANKR